MAKSVKLSDNLLALIEERGFSNEELSILTGVSYPTICRAIRKLSTSQATADLLVELLGEDILEEESPDNYGVVGRFREAEAAGNTYRLVKQRYVFQVGIDHPTKGFLVRHSGADKAHAKKALEKFNGGAL